MAVKGYKIIESLQLVMHCDSCGEEMPPGIFKSVPYKNDGLLCVNWIDNPPKIDYYFEYTCRRCGNVQKSRNSYPCQQVRFNKDDVIDVEDSGQV